MKVVQINGVCGIGSTGKIAAAVSKLLTEQGIENYILYSSLNTDDPLGIKFSNRPYQLFQAGLSRILGNDGLNCIWSTQNLIRHIEKIGPDVALIHNIHSHDVNLKILFAYFRKNPKTKIYYVFHDCWAFTGYCPHFSMLKCGAWTSECNSCPYRKTVSWFFDRSGFVFNEKKKALRNQNLTIITPSQWLADLVRQSFLKDYPVKVIHNGIDLNIFRPTESNFREKYGIPKDKYLLLGVAFGWGRQKGLDVFLELANRLDSEKFQIVLVGTDETVDRRLPKQIISIHRTQNRQELTEIYTAADLFVNPTREENYPTVNMESIACGTPVLTFRTGGSPEIVDKTTGAVVDCDDVDALEREIVRICTERPYTKDACLKKAEEFDSRARFEEYVRILAGD